jgi:hypothetical protein
MRRRTGLLCLILCASALITTSCVPAGLGFFQDNRVHILWPQQAATLSLPVHLHWDVHGFHLTGPTGSSAPDDGYFAVTVDRNPMPPGQSLRWFASRDPSCHASNGCPNATYLAELGVYTTATTNLTLRALPPLAPNQEPRWHEVTIVLLDGTGHRIGESAFYVDFYLTRDLSAS